MNSICYLEMKKNKQMFKYKAEFQMFRFYNIIKVIKPIIKKSRERWMIFL